MLLAAATLTISLADALSRARQAPDAVVARAETVVARRQVRVAGAPASPILTVGTSRYSAKESASVSQEIRWGGERRHAVASAEATARAAVSRERAALLAARRLVREAWSALAAAEDLERVSGESAARASQVADAVNARFEAGRVPRMDAVRARAEAARLAAESKAAAETRRGAWADLATLLALDATSEGATDGVRPAAPAPDALAALASSAHEEEAPDVAAARAALESAAQDRLAARSRLLPGLAASVGVNADDPGNPGPDYQASLSLTIPVGGRGTAPLRLAEAEVDVRRAEWDAARRKWRGALESARHRALGASARLAALTTEALPAAEEAARLTREAYEAGRGDLLRVLDAEQTLAGVRRDRLEAWRESFAAAATLAEAAGEAGVVEEAGGHASP